MKTLLDWETEFRGLEVPGPNMEDIVTTESSTGKQLIVCGLYHDVRYHIAARLKFDNSLRIEELDCSNPDLLFITLTKE